MKRDIEIGFPPASFEDWKALARKSLGRGDGDLDLTFTTDEGLRLASLYEKAENPLPLPLRQPAKPWIIAQRVDHPDPDRANEFAIDELSNGASGFVLVARSSAAAHGYGLHDWTAPDLGRAIRNLPLDRIVMRVDAGGASAEIARLLSHSLYRKNMSRERMAVNFGIDPIGAMASFGVGLAEADFDIAADLTKEFPAGYALCADGRVWHDAGAGEAQEIAFVIATAVQYLRELEQRGVALDRARSAVAFLLAADCDQFVTMAKFRALRRMWARIEQVSGLPVSPIHVGAETSWRMSTRLDPDTNILRNTIAALAAGLSGADVVTVLPHTIANGLPDQDARRIAHNVQSILIEEAYASAVGDPAAGSGAFEAMTEALAERAWDIFRKLEGSGGIAANLGGGDIQAAIARVAESRNRRISTGEQSIVGTNVFPVVSEEPVSKLQPPTETPVLSALPAARLAAPFERLRERAATFEKNKGRPLQVFLANLGSSREFQERASFAKSLLAVGGIRTVEGKGTDDPDLFLADIHPGIACACICGSDETYARRAGGRTFAERAAQDLRRAGYTLIFLAGQPGKNEVPYRAAGIDNFLYAGCDVVGAISQLLGHEDPA